MLTVAWGKRSAAPGNGSLDFGWLKANFTFLAQGQGNAELILAFSQSKTLSSPSWGGATLAPGYGDGLAFSQ
jgi:hypothetical protein